VLCTHDLQIIRDRLPIRNAQVFRVSVSDPGPVAPFASISVFFPLLAPGPVAPFASVSVPVPVAAPSGADLPAAACDPVLVAAQVVAVPFVFEIVPFLLDVPIAVVLAGAVFVPHPVAVPLPVSIVDFVPS